MQETDFHRLKNLREYLNFQQGDFATSIELKQGSYSDIERGRSAISRQVLEKLAEVHKISPNYLLFGSGPQFLPEGTPNGTPISTPNIVNEPSEQFIKSLFPPMVTVDEIGQDNIVMVDTKAAAGYITRLHEPEFYKQLPAFKLPGHRFRNATFRTFEVEGDSMTDTIYNQDWVVGRFLSDFRDIKEGYVHVVVTREDICVKRVLNRVDERGVVVLLSDNEDYSPFEVSINEVQEVWRVVFKMSPFLPNKSHDWKRLISGLQADMVGLQRRIERLESNKRS